MRWLFSFNVFSICFISLGFIAAPQAIYAQASAATYALVVGISDYKHTEITRLEYAHRDAQAFYTFLRSEAGGVVPQENITVLLNETATFGAIYAAMEQIITKVQANDRVIFYFAGHGDVERITMHQLGYLLAYNTPPHNYINHAVRIEDLNDFANTLSNQKGAQVFLFTDACRSGNLAGNRVNGRLRVATQLQGGMQHMQQQRQVRVASCGPAELSAEHAVWGGGRGVFSYYLVNGLYGMAAKNNDDWIDAEALMQFIRTSLANDKQLMAMQHRQQPMAAGNLQLPISRRSQAELQRLQVSQSAGTNRQAFAGVLNAFAELPASPLDYLGAVFQHRPINEVFKFSTMQGLKGAALQNRVFEVLMPVLSNNGKDSLNMLKAQLHAGMVQPAQLEEKLAVLVSNRGQQIINEYLTGDQAALESRSYYNIHKGYYDDIVAMYTTALAWLPVSHYLYRGMQLDKYYFEGVLWRLKVPLVKDKQACLAKAMKAQQLAHTSDPYVPYVHNELANLYVARRQFDSATYHFEMAMELSPTWALPHAHLAAMYNVQGKYAAARMAAQKADSLQSGIVSVQITKGITAELENNLLQAEGLQKRSIQQNNQHFLPYDRLGMMYIKTARFALADSFLFESSRRREGFEIPPNQIAEPSLSNPTVMRFPKTSYDTCWDALYPTKDPMPPQALLLALKAWRQEPGGLAEHYFRKALHSQSLAFAAHHFFAMYLFQTGQAMQAFQHTQHALKHWDDFTDWNSLLTAEIIQNNWPALSACDAELLSLFYPDKAEAALLAAACLFKLQYYAAADDIVTNLLQTPAPLTALTGATILKARILESTNRYYLAEQAWLLVAEKLRQLRQGAGEPADRWLNSGRPEIMPYEAPGIFYASMVKLFPYQAYWHYRAAALDYSILQSDAAYKNFTMEDEAFAVALAEDARRFLGKPVWMYKFSWSIITALPVYPFSLSRLWQNLYNGNSFAVQDEDRLNGYLLLADMHAAVARYDSAAFYFQSAQVFLPGDAGLLWKKANAFANADYLFEAYGVLDTLQRSGLLFPDQQLSFAQWALYAGNSNYLDSLAKSTGMQDPAFRDSVFMLRAVQYHMLYDFRQGIPFIRRQALPAMDASVRAYMLARLYAMQRRHKEARQWLSKAMKAGFAYWYVLEADPAWDNTPNWKQTRLELLHTYSSQFKKYAY